MRPTEQSCYLQRVFLVERSCGAETQGEPWSKPAYSNCLSLFTGVFLFACNLAQRPIRQAKPIKQNNFQKGTPVEGTAGGRGGAVSPTFCIILSLPFVCAFVLVLLVRNSICDAILVNIA